MSSISVADLSDDEVCKVTERLRSTDGPSPAINLLGALPVVLKQGVFFQSVEEAKNFLDELRERYRKIMAVQAD